MNGFDNRLFAGKYLIKSLRLSGWNYSLPAHYFITICTHNKFHYFGKKLTNYIKLSNYGQIAFSELTITQKYHPYLIISPWIIMPNHIHLLISFRPEQTHFSASLNPHFTREQTHLGAPLHAPFRYNHPDFFHQLNQKSNQIIPNLIKQFKSAVTRHCQKQNLYFAWQSGYYDQIIRTPKHLISVKKYIINNPIKWNSDKFH